MLTEKQSAELWEEAELLSERAAAETKPEESEGHYGHLEAAQKWLAEYAHNNKVKESVRKLTSELLDTMAEEGWII